MSSIQCSTVWKSIFFVASQKYKKNNFHKKINIIAKNLLEYLNEKSLNKGKVLS